MSQYEDLLSQLDQIGQETTDLVKALPKEGGEDDQAIQAAAEEGEDTDADKENPEDHEEPDGDEDPKAEKKPMTKAVIDGEEVEVIDATDMIKALNERIDATDGVLAKALSTTLETVKAQGELIKSLQTQVAKMGKTGAGRKSVLAVVEKPVAGENLVKSEQDGMTPKDFMAKANAAFDAKKLSGRELATLDAALRANQIAAFPELVAKALS